MDNDGWMDDTKQACACGTELCDLVELQIRLLRFVSGLALANMYLEQDPWVGHPFLAPIPSKVNVHPGGLNMMVCIIIQTE